MPALRTRDAVRWQLQVRGEAIVRDFGRKLAFKFSSSSGVHSPDSLFFHHALQRMLMFACKVHHLCDLRLRNLVCIDPTFAYSVVMHMQHNSCGGFVILSEEPLQDMHNELHGCVVVIENEYAIHVRPLGLRLGLGDNPGGRSALIVPALAVLVSHARRVGPPRGGQDLTGLPGCGHHGWAAASYIPGGCAIAASVRGRPS